MGLTVQTVSTIVRELEAAAFLASAACLGVAPWMLSSLGEAAAQTASPQPASQRRKLGALEVFSVGL